MIKYGLIYLDSLSAYEQVAEAAYYLWLNGSEDTEKNWNDAVDEIKLMTNKINVDAAITEQQNLIIGRDTDETKQ